MPFDRLWQRIGKLTLGLVAFNLASHIVMPGLNFSVFARYIRNAPGGSLLWLYDRLGGGGLSRVSIVALGFMPYLTARIGLLIAQRAFPGLQQLSESADGKRALKRWTRGLTVGASLIQSYGFAQNLLNVPGLVLEPDPGFVVRMMAVLTGGAIVAMMLSESAEELVMETMESAAEPVDELPSVEPLGALTSGPTEPLTATSRGLEKRATPL